MDKLLLIGMDTLAGANLAVMLGDRCELVVVSQQAGFELDSGRILYVESDAARTLAEIVAVEQPRCVVYCGPSCTSSWDEGNAMDSAAEAKRAKAVEQAVGKCGGRMIFLSTDAVFAGPRLFHHETFPTAENSPRSTAARSVEQALTAAETLILRTHLFGWSASGASYAERMWNLFAEGRQPKVSGASYATPILASDSAEFIWQAYRRKLTGLYHLGGAERISHWHFAAALARGCGARFEKAAPEKTAVTDQSAAMEETSLDSRRLQKALSMPLPSVREGIDRFIEQAANGYRQRLQTGSAGRVPELSAA